MSESYPLVTVIIPSYNHEHYVREAVESVLEQDFPKEKFELVIIDDGSKDASVNIIEEVVGLYPDNAVQFYTQSNQGICNTLNRAVSCARGKYVMFLASDDKHLPNTMSILAGVLECDIDEKFCAVYGDGYIVNAIGERVGVFSQIIPTPVLKGKRRELLVRNFIPGVGCMYRKAAIEQVGGFDPNVNVEDWDLLLRLTKNGALKSIGEFVFEYRRHDSNITSDDEKMSALLRTMAEKHQDWAAYYYFKQALFNLNVRGIFNTMSVSNLSLLVRMVIAQARVLIGHFVR